MSLTLLVLKNYELIFEFLLCFLIFVFLSFILINNSPHTLLIGGYFSRKNRFCWKLITLTSIVFKKFYRIFNSRRQASQQLLFRFSPFFIGFTFWSRFVLHKSWFSRLASDLFHSLFQLKLIQLRNVVKTVKVKRSEETGSNDKARSLSHWKLGYKSS